MRSSRRADKVWGKGCVQLERWAPDGKALVYTRGIASVDEYDIWTFDTKTGRDAPLVPVSFEAGAPPPIRAPTGPERGRPIGRELRIAGAFGLSVSLTPTVGA